MMKRCLVVALGIVLVATVVISFYPASATSPSSQTMNVAGSEAQFKLSIAYAYVGKGPNASYTAANGVLMSPSSLYPSAVVFNITRVPENQIAACDAEIEVYGVHISTDNGVLENHAYFVGTNDNPSLSSSDLSTIVEHANDMIDQRVFSDARGNFNFNWTENTSITSHAVGSIGSYWSMPSSAGLWSAGKPNAISVSVNRIGYVTITNGSISVYEDVDNKAAIAQIQLDNYEDGFLHNTVPADKLSQTNPFQIATQLP